VAVERQAPDVENARARVPAQPRGLARAGRPFQHQIRVVVGVRLIQERRRRLRVHREQRLQKEARECVCDAEEADGDEPADSVQVHARRNRRAERPVARLACRAERLDRAVCHPGRADRPRLPFASRRHQEIRGDVVIRLVDAP
jgi:hypothetical protein